MWWLIMGLLLVLHSRASAAGIDPLSHDCTGSDFTYTLGSPFEANLNQSLTQLIDKSSQLRFSNFTNGTGIDQAYALYYCTGDTNLPSCHSCVQTAAQSILQLCNLLKEGVVWFESCTLRYANRSIFSKEELSPGQPYYNHTPAVSSFVLAPYRDKFDTTIKALMDKAANNPNLLGFATSQVNLSSTMSLRGLVQCSPDILGAPCYHCLQTSLRLMDLWSNTMYLLPSCRVGYYIYGSPSSSITPLPKKPLSVGIIVLIVLLCILVLSIIGGFWLWKRQRIRQDPLAEVNQETESVVAESVDVPEASERGRPRGLTRFSYSEMEIMTNWFSRKIGEGGYGIVYHGRLTDASRREVAIKVLSKRDAPAQFSTEIDVLGRISHKNLVSLIGYCEEDSHLALIYEYMARGDLRALLTENAGSLPWRKRLEIAIDTAQGLDYLHNGCSPPIVHRDVKPANVLLNQDLRAKVADFGFSKIFPDEYLSSLSTRVVGTLGYVDPLYNQTGKLNEKGDVYSFGVVILELITGRVAIRDNTNLVLWVRPQIESGDVESILDPKLRQDINENYSTIWKATELAMRCVDLDGTQRPTMSQIVTDLKECLAMETHTQVYNVSPSSMEMATALISNTLMSPSAR